MGANHEVTQERAMFIALFHGMQAIAEHAVREASMPYTHPLAQHQSEHRRLLSE
jgi:hypothetical protein